MMVSLFVLLLVAVLFAWFGFRKIAINVFSVFFILAIATFLHHLTTHLTLQL